MLSFALFVYVLYLRLADGIIQSRWVKVKGLIISITLAVIPASLPVLVMSGYRLE